MGNYIRNYIKKMIKIFIWIMVIYWGIVLSWNYIVDPTTITADIEKYGQFERFRGYSDLEVFPLGLPEQDEDVEYYYQYKEGIFDPQCQIYLKCIYNTEEYEKEILRLTQIERQYKGRIQKIRYNIVDFAYPAYVAMFQSNGCYEYALLDEEQHSIIYVFLQWMEPEAITFANQYLPYHYDDSGETEKSFSVYDFLVENGAYYSHPRDISRFK